MAQERAILISTEGSVGHDDAEQLALARPSLILAEKRTFLSVMRTGIAVIALPLAMISALIATSSIQADRGAESFR